MAQVRARRWCGHDRHYPWVERPSSYPYSPGLMYFVLGMTSACLDSWEGGLWERVDDLPTVCVVETSSCLGIQRGEHYENMAIAFPWVVSWMSTQEQSDKPLRNRSTRCAPCVS